MPKGQYNTPPYNIISIIESNRHTSFPFKEESASFLPSQTEAFLSLIGGFESILKEMPQLANWRINTKQILQTESKYKNTHYCFYHSTAGLYLFYTLISEIVQIALKVNFDNNFTFFRIPGNPIFNRNNRTSFFSRHPDPSVALDTNIQKKIVAKHLDILGYNYHDLLSKEEINITHNTLYSLYRGWIDKVSVEKKFVTSISKAVKRDDYLQLDSFISQFLENASRVYGELRLNNKQSAYFSKVKNELELLEEECYQNAKIRRRMSSIEYLPVNISLYGQCQENNACSSLLRWQKAITYDAPYQEHLVMELFKAFKIDSCHLAFLSKIYEEIKSYDSILFAIFIPKCSIDRNGKLYSIIDQNLFISHAWTKVCSELDTESNSQLIKELTEGTFTDSIELLKKTHGMIIVSHEHLLNPFSGIKMIPFFLSKTHAIKLYKFRKQVRKWLKSRYASKAISYS